MQLVEALADRGIRLRKLAPDYREQILCPRCGGGRSREHSLTVTVDHDGQGAVWTCHRGKCDGNTGSVRVGQDRSNVFPPSKPREYSSPKPVSTNEQTRPDWLYDCFAERRIGARVIEKLGIYATSRFFPPPMNQNGPAIVFPYVFNGNVVNRKYRPHPQKHPMQQERDALPTLYNVDSISADHPLIWVEGEWDVAALVECGFEHVVTLKDGAPKDGAVRDEKRFAALATHEEHLKKVKRHIMAGDQDVPGHALQEELARRLGRHRVMTVTWPEDCKDACDVLRLHGPDRVRACVEKAKHYPMDGLQEIHPTTLLELRGKPPPATMTTGTSATDAMLKLPTEGRLIIVTGYSNQGKTSWVRFVMVHTMREHERRWLVFSAEQQPWTNFVKEVGEVYIGKPLYARPPLERMSDDEALRAGEWLSGRCTMLVYAESPTLDWVLERADAAILRYGITDLHIDPWNELEHNRGGMTETDYTAQCLTRLKLWGLNNGVNVWIGVHPAKPLRIRAGEEAKVPEGYDISGSQHWFGKADLGLTIFSSKQNEAELYVWKSRHSSLWGMKGGAPAVMDFDHICGLYRDPIRAVGGVIA